MSPPRSDLSLAGVLYAGCDFEEWAARARAALRLAGFKINHVELRHSPFGTIAPSEQAATLLCSPLLVSASVLARISTSPAQSSSKLWERLEAQSKPFRLMDLPAELRDTVYELAFDGEDHFVKQDGHTPVHPLLQVSGQVRHETLPLFSGCTNVLLRPNPPMREEDRIEVRLEPWMEEVANSHMEYFRSVDLELIVKGTDHAGYLLRQYKVICFTFNKADGLRSEIPYGELALHSLTWLQEHVARVERDRKIVHLEGECILLALLSEPELWSHGELEWLS